MDRSELKTLLSGLMEVPQGTVAPGHPWWGNPGFRIRYDLTEAQRLMREAGYPEEQVDHAGRMLRKEGIKRDPEVQALEDVACFTFIRHYLGDFATTQEPDALLVIVQKTARKMSPEARTRALAEFPMPAQFAAAFELEDAR